MSNLMRRLRDPAFGTETSERNLMNQAADRIAQLEGENASLASWQCEFTDGKTGLVYGEGGSTYCAMAKRVQKLEAMLREVMEQCPEHVPYGLKNQIRATLGEERT